MKNPAIEQIWKNFIRQKDYDELVLSDEDITAADNAAHQAFDAAALGKMELPEVDDLVCAAHVEYERFGFVNGFKAAMRIMRECYAEVTA